MRFAERRGLAPLAGHRSALRGRPSRRARPMSRRRSREPLRISGAPIVNLDRLDERHGQRLGGEADRRVSGRGAEPAGAGRLSAGRGDGHLPRPLPRELRDAEGDRVEQAAAVQVHPAAGESRVPAGTPDHGAGPVAPGSRSTTAIRRRSCRTSSSRSRKTTSRRRSASIAPRARRATSTCPSSRARVGAAGRRRDFAIVSPDANVGLASSDRLQQGDAPLPGEGPG